MNEQAIKVRAEHAWLAVVQSHVGSLRFGTVQIQVHDSRVVQIERTERVRFDAPENSSLGKPAPMIAKSEPAQS